MHGAHYPQAMPVTARSLHLPERPFLLQSAGGLVFFKLESFK